MTRRLIFIVLLLAIRGMAQERIDTLRGVVRAFYLPMQDLVLRTHLDGISLTPPDKPEAVIHRKINGWKFEHAISESFMIGRELVTIDNLTRTVYRVSGDSLVISEKIPHPWMTINARMVQHDSTVYMAGGYGLWSTRQPLLALDPVHFRWNPVIIGDGTAKSGPIAPGIHESVFFSEGDRLYLIHGKMLEPARPLENPLNELVWTFDLQTHKWNSPGSLNREVFDNEPQAFWSIATDRHIILFPSSKAVVKLLAHENKVIQYHQTVFSEEVRRESHGYFQAFFRKGKIYYHRLLAVDPPAGEYEGRTVEFAAIPEDRFFGKMIGTADFYVTGFSLEKTLYWVAGLLIIAAAFAGYRLARRTITAATLTKDGIRYKGVNHELDPQALAILKKLLEASGPVASNELLELVKNPDLKYAHNNRVKNDLIRELNVQLRSIFNCKEDLITSTAADQDKRFRLYQVDKRRFEGG